MSLKGLFLVLNYIADNLTSKVALFADDSVLLREAGTNYREDQLQLQNDLTKLIMWSNT